MKHLITIALLLIATTVYSQNKNAKASLEVDGVCNMCKARIEKACLNTKGVKHATWNVETHQLKLIYNANKTDLKTIEKQVLAAGHDTKNAKAPDEAYNKVHPCCKYRDQVVVDGHKEE